MHSPHPDGISVIIPTYNEVNNVPHLVDAVSQSLANTSTFELIIVDDNSTDGTILLVKDLMTTRPWLKLIVRNGSPSLSKAVIEGFSTATYNRLVSMDADLSHPPQMIAELAANLANDDTHFVIGSRYVAGGNTSSMWPKSRKITSYLAATLARHLLPVYVADPLSGFFALRKQTFLQAEKLNPVGWKIALELMVKCKCTNITEVPIFFEDRMYDTSKLSMKIAIEYLIHILRLKHFKLTSAWKQS